MTTKPQTLSKYRIEAELGRGGMGVVYRATQTESGLTVAIKVLPAEMAREGGFAERFAREIATLQKLAHRNIVQLIEPGEDQGYQYYVMEFVEGTSLDKIIAAERRIPWERAVEIAVQICAGLKHAHDHGVIHRDLKPANLLITNDGTVKLTDFGIAKVFAGTAITGTGGIIGTPEYMSPEQGDGRPVTHRTDLYSLGAVLYSMLTGRPPFVGRGVAGLINQHRFGQFDRPTAVVPEIPSWLDELVCQLLEKEPGKRPADAHVVARRLEAIPKKVALRSAQTIMEGDATIASEGSKTSRRHTTGPATLMQRLLRAQLKEIDDPGWLGRQFQKTSVLATGLVLAVGTLTLFAFTRHASSEKRRWNEIEKIVQSGDDHDTAVLVERVKEYLRRYPDGAHAEQAKSILSIAESERRQIEFLRSAATKLRPRPEPVSELERLYRKALLQQWLEGDDAARATLQEIRERDNVPPRDQFLLTLVEEDLLSLDLRCADRLRAEGQSDEAAQLLHEIIDQHESSTRYRQWVRAAKRALAELSRESGPDSQEAGP